MKSYGNENYLGQTKNENTFKNSSLGGGGTKAEFTRFVTLSVVLGKKKYGEFMSRMSKNFRME